MGRGDIAGVALRAKLVKEVVLVGADPFNPLPGLRLIFLEPDEHPRIEASHAGPLNGIMLGIGYHGMDIVMNLRIAEILPSDHAVAHDVPVLIHKDHRRTLRRQADGLNA